MLGSVMGFLFGKQPKIFDADGSVRHDLPKEKWDQWNRRYTDNPQYNWKNHTGMKASSPRKREN